MTKCSLCTEECDGCPRLVDRDRATGATRLLCPRCNFLIELRTNPIDDMLRGLEGLLRWAAGGQP